MIAAELIKPLPFKEIPMPKWYAETEEKIGYWEKHLRIIFFDPVQCYENAGELIDPYKRIQKGLNTEKLFPKRNDGICRCGCGIESGKRLWASQNCSNFAYSVYFLITYGTAQAGKYLQTYYGGGCFTCDGTGHEIDHIIPVKHGGGGCWISNFVYLCNTCHKDKTKKDFQWGQYKPTTQLALL